MGLLYVFPVSENEAEHTQIINNEIKLKTYGLPYIFWGYLAAILLAIFFMGLGIYSPLIKLWSGDDFLNQVIALMAFLVLTLVPLILTSAFFYEKILIKKGEQIKICHKIFFIPIWSRKYILKDLDAIELRHFMQSPNVAKKTQIKDMKAFENRGYYEIIGRNQKDKMFFIDRHSQKSELKKLFLLLKKY